MLSLSVVPVHGQPSSRPVGPITGIVVNGATNEPIQGALVTVFDGQDTSPRAVTGVDGRFTFPQLGSDVFRLQASRRGFHSESGLDFEIFELNRMRPGDGIRIKLYPLCVIHGHLNNKDGEPLQGLMVQALRVSISNGRLRVSEYGPSRSNDLGDFRLWYLDAGRYYVRVTGRGQTIIGIGESPVSRADESYGPIYYPSSPTQDTAQMVRLAAGETMRVDFTLESRPAFTVSGKLVNLPAYKEVQVHLISGRASAGGRTLVNAASGAFEISEVPAGTYTLRAEATGGEAALFGEALVRVEDRDVAGVVVTMTSGVNVSGAVHFPDTTKRHSGSVSAEPLSDDPGPRFERYASIQGDGTFVLERMLPGRYRIRAAMGEYFASSIRAGDVDVLRDDLVVPLEGAPPELVIEGSAGGGAIEGTVSGIEKKDRVARIAIAEGDCELAVPITTASGEDYLFRVQSLPPGEYRVFAWTDPAQIEYRNPQALQALSADAVTVTVTAGGTQKVTVKAITKGDN